MKSLGCRDACARHFTYCLGENMYYAKLLFHLTAVVATSGHQHFSHAHAANETALLLSAALSKMLSHQTGTCRPRTPSASSRSLRVHTVWRLVGLARLARIS